VLLISNIYVLLKVTAYGVVRDVCWSQFADQKKFGVGEQRFFRANFHHAYNECKMLQGQTVVREEKSGGHAKE
jgi:hypothetical protein